MRRKIDFAIDEYYHICNRGVEKKNIFIQNGDFQRFVNYLIYFNTEKPSWAINDLREAGKNANPKEEEKLVGVVAYCLNSNHFHLILREKKQNGIVTFMKKISTGYAMYFNKKYKHSGFLFQGRFKAIHISSNKQLIYVSAYINCNCEIHRFSKSKDYIWSSFREYAGKTKESFLEKKSIIKQFRSKDEYCKYALSQIDNMRKNKDKEGVFIE